ncbi:hypothetical protein AS9A_3523 [Hoyosella subflava DQS3-9A1]|uniref:Uncharacterized protein n=1 Tax=Hoyosella subflava (strain DSM 45089 / JCM 17490 / NBRC 109087 / DQS3-9A1) TaxID=443218 RepID=F6ER85_HOYSD|nr:hypothetical protein AS9A_3523 [Hoyosella subflava DQS3-9A1]
MKALGDLCSQSASRLHPRLSDQALTAWVAGLAVAAAVTAGCAHTPSEAEQSATTPMATEHSERKTEGRNVQRDGGESDGHFTIMDEPTALPRFPLLPDDCSAPASDGKIIFVCAGAQYGEISVTVETLPAPPAQPETGWQEVFDTHVTSTTGDLYLWTGMATRFPGISEPLTYKPGTYQVRIHINGRLENRGWPTNVTDETYLIQIWEHK